MSLFNEFESTLSDQLGLPSLNSLVNEEIRKYNVEDFTKRTDNEVWETLMDYFLELLAVAYVSKHKDFYSVLTALLRGDMESASCYFFIVYDKKVNWEYLNYWYSREKMSTISKEIAHTFLNSLSLKERIIIELYLPR